MILAVRPERVTRRLKGRLPAAEHAPDAVRWWAVIIVSARIPRSLRRESVADSERPAAASTKHMAARRSPASGRQGGCCRAQWPGRRTTSRPVPKPSWPARPPVSPSATPFAVGERSLSSSIQHAEARPHR
jgi:hypothetical protein